MRLLNNIDVFQVEAGAGQQEAYFPKSVVWSGKKINRIVVVGSVSNKTEYSPIDGQTPLLPASSLKNVYLDLVDTNGVEIAHNMHVSCVLFNNNNPHTIDAVLDLPLCRFSFDPTISEYGCFLVYVIYEEAYKQIDLRRSVTLHFRLAASESISVKEMINEYMHIKTERVKGITAWNADEAPFYLTLRDEDDTFVFNSVHACLMRPQTNRGASVLTQASPFLLDSIDVDMDNSFVRNAIDEEIEITLTFYY